jgi:hypothetical protein
MARILNFAILLTFLAPLAFTAPTTPSNAALKAQEEYGVFYICYPGCYTLQECACYDG